MARKRYAFDEKKILAFLKTGRGQGCGPDYQPWFSVHEVPSSGRAHRTKGRATGRIHHFLSDIEFNSFLIFDWSDDVVDIREQYPLDRDETRRIADAIGVRHPADPETQTDIVMSTDLLVDLSRNGVSTKIARSVKHSSALENSRTLEKLEIERRYWFENGVDYRIITERELPEGLVRILRWLEGHSKPLEGIPEDLLNQIDQDLDQDPELSFGEFCEQIDSRYGLPASTGRSVSNHLLATKAWLFDLHSPIGNDTPVSAFHRNPDKKRSGG